MSFFCRKLTADNNPKRNTIHTVMGSKNPNPVTTISGIQPGRPASKSQFKKGPMAITRHHVGVSDAGPHAPICLYRTIQAGITIKQTSRILKSNLLFILASSLANVSLDATKNPRLARVSRSHPRLGSVYSLSKWTNLRAVRTQ